MPKHTMLYIITDGDVFFDGEAKSWDDVIENAAAWRNDDMRVFEMMTTTTRTGRHIAIGKDVTDEAIDASERAKVRRPWGIVEQQRELGTVF